MNLHFDVGPYDDLGLPRHKGMLCLLLRNELRKYNPVSSPAWQAESLQHRIKAYLSVWVDAGVLESAACPEVPDAAAVVDAAVLEALRHVGNDALVSRTAENVRNELVARCRAGFEKIRAEWPSKPHQPLPAEVNAAATMPASPIIAEITAREGRQIQDLGAQAEFHTGGDVGNDQAADHRAAVDRFIERVSKVRKIRKKDIWTVAGYKNRTEFERFQRKDPKATKSGIENFTRVLAMTPEAFIEALDKKLSPK